MRCRKGHYLFLPTDKSVPNESSIALVVEHQGASMLLSADAFSPVLVPALRALAKRRGIHGRIEVDAVKLSHHGSRANVTNELLAAVEAKHLIFSTNNEYFNHPNEEAVARVVVNGEHPTLWFNYDTPKNRKWSSPALLAKYGYSARFPTDESSGAGTPSAGSDGRDARKLPPPTTGTGRHCE